MSQVMAANGTPFFTGDAWGLVAGVRTRRVMAFAIDLIVLTLLTAAAAVAIFFLGLLTLGLGWTLYIILWPCLALLYVCATLGGPASATPGMQVMGLEMRMIDGTRPSWVIALVHVVLFWIGAATFMIMAASWLCSLLNSRKRMLHDLLIGVVVVNTAALQRLGL